jgi:adenine-specific DNA-methyltransferase
MADSIASESFGFYWPGKQAAAGAAREPVRSALVDGDGHLPDIEEHLFIEGENSEALRALQHSHTGMVKMIYIDPPYNSGNKFFIYDDKFRLAKGRKKGATLNNSGIVHSEWLSMIYTRLILARQLLREDGAIFISIDDGEAAHLKMMLNEVFGGNNFIGQLVWINRTTPNDAAANFATDHEYILIYARNRSKCRFAGVAKDLARYRNPDNDPAGPWVQDNPSAASGSEHYRFPIMNPYTGQQYLPPKGRFWAFAPSRVAEWTASGKLVFPKVRPRRFLLKKYLSELRSPLKPMSSIVNGILTAEGTRELKILFGGESPFRYPKPVALIEYLVEQATGETDIILDFFAGSATTAHAVLQLNAMTGSRRKFICVQRPEPNGSKDDVLKARYPLVSDVTRARIDKVIAQLIADPETLHKHQLHYRVFKLTDAAE